MAKAEGTFRLYLEVDTDTGALRRCARAFTELADSLDALESGHPATEHSWHVSWNPETEVWGWTCQCNGSIGEVGFFDSDSANEAALEHIGTAPQEHWAEANPAKQFDSPLPRGHHLFQSPQGATGELCSLVIVADETGIYKCRRQASDPVHRRIEDSDV